MQTSHSTSTRSLSESVRQASRRGLNNSSLLTLGKPSLKRSFFFRQGSRNPGKLDMNMYWNQCRFSTSPLKRSSRLDQVTHRIDQFQRKLFRGKPLSSSAKNGAFFLGARGRLAPEADLRSRRADFESPAHVAAPRLGNENQSLRRRKLRELSSKIKSLRKVTRTERPDPAHEYLCSRCNHQLLSLAERRSGPSLRRHCCRPETFCAEREPFSGGEEAKGRANAATEPGGSKLDIQDFQNIFLFQGDLGSPPGRPGNQSLVLPQKRSKFKQQILNLNRSQKQFDLKIQFTKQARARGAGARESAKENESFRSGNLSGLSAAPKRNLITLGVAPSEGESEAALASAPPEKGEEPLPRAGPPGSGASARKANFRELLKVANLEFLFFKTEKRQVREPKAPPRSSKNTSINFYRPSRNDVHLCEFLSNRSLEPEPPLCPQPTISLLDKVLGGSGQKPQGAGEGPGDWLSQFKRRLHRQQGRMLLQTELLEDLHASPGRPDLSVFTRNCLRQTRNFAASRHMVRLSPVTHRSPSQTGRRESSFSLARTSGPSPAREPGTRRSDFSFEVPVRSDPSVLVSLQSARNQRNLHLMEELTRRSDLFDVSMIKFQQRSAQESFSRLWDKSKSHTRIKECKSICEITSEANDFESTDRAGDFPDQEPPKRRRGRLANTEDSLKKVFSFSNNKLEPRPRADKFQALTALARRLRAKALASGGAGICRKLLRSRRLCIALSAVERKAKRLLKKSLLLVKTGVLERSLAAIAGRRAREELRRGFACLRRAAGQRESLGRAVECLEAGLKRAAFAEVRAAARARDTQKEAGTVRKVAGNLQIIRQMDLIQRSRGVPSEGAQASLARERRPEKRHASQRATQWRIEVPQLPFKIVKTVLPHSSKAVFRGLPASPAFAPGKSPGPAQRNFTQTFSGKKIGSKGRRRLPKRSSLGRRRQRPNADQRDLRKAERGGNGAECGKSREDPKQRRCSRSKEGNGERGKRGKKALIRDLNQRLYASKEKQGPKRENVISVGELIFQGKPAPKQTPAKPKKTPAKPKKTPAKPKKASSKSRASKSSKRRVPQRAPARAAPDARTSNEVSMKRFFENLETSGAKAPRPPKKGKRLKRQMQSKIRELSQRLSRCSKEKVRAQVIRKHMLDKRPPPMVFSIEKSPLDPGALIRLDQDIKQKRDRRRFSVQTRKDPARREEPPNIGQLHNKLSAVYLENKYQTQKMRDLGYYRELLRQMDFKSGRVNPALGLKGQEGREAAGKAGGRRPPASGAKQRKERAARSSQEYQLLKIKSEASIKLGGLELSGANSSTKRVVRKAEHVREILSSRILDKEDMQASICNSQLVISNKKKSFNCSGPTREGSRQKAVTTAKKTEAGGAQRDGARVASFQKQIFREISSRLGEREFDEVLRLSGLRKNRSGTLKASAQLLLQNKGFCEKLILNARPSKLLSNRPPSSKTRRVQRKQSSSKANCMKAETGSNPSTSQLPGADEAGQLPPNAVLQSSSGVGSRVRETRGRRRGRRRFDPAHQG